MKNIIKLAKHIICKTLTNLPSIKVDFSVVRKKIDKLENGISTFNGDDESWEKIENWKPLAEEIIQDLEDIMGKL
jgi:hypothetical protein